MAYEVRTLPSKGYQIIHPDGQVQSHRTGAAATEAVKKLARAGARGSRGVMFRFYDAEGKLAHTAVYKLDAAGKVVRVEYKTPSGRVKTGATKRKRKAAAPKPASARKPSAKKASARKPSAKKASAKKTSGSVPGVSKGTAYRTFVKRAYEAGAKDMEAVGRMWRKHKAEHGIAAAAPAPKRKKASAKKASARKPSAKKASAKKAAPAKKKAPAKKAAPAKRTPAKKKAPAKRKTTRKATALLPTATEAAAAARTSKPTRKGGKKTKRPMTAWMRHVQKVRKAGGSMEDAAASYHKKG